MATQVREVMMLDMSGQRLEGGVHCVAAMVSSRRHLSSVLLLAVFILAAWAPMASATEARAACPGSQNDGGSGTDAGSNNTTAVQLATDPTLSTTGCVDANDQVDFYAIPLTAGNDLDIRLTSPSGADFDPYLLDQNGSLIDFSYAASLVEHVSTAGTTVHGGGQTVYLAVQQYLGDGDYDLDFWTNTSQALSDVEPLWIEGPGVFAETQQVTLRYELTNQGQGASGAFDVEFVVSTNTIITSFDTSIGNASEASLAAGASRVSTASVTIPSGLSSSTYYWGVMVDPFGNLSERDTGNNAVPSNGSSTKLAGSDPDLVITDTNAPTQALDGASIQVNATVANAGLSSSSATQIEWYLSTNDIISTSDTSLGTSSLGGLASGANLTVGATVTLPAGTTGSRYIGVIADPLDTVNEGEEANNAGTGVPIDILVDDEDLTVSEIDVPWSATLGTPFDVDIEVRNLGTRATPVTDLAVWLLRGSSWNATHDLELANVSVPAVAGAGMYNATVSITIPTNASYGAHRITVVADAGHDVDEADETNNAMRPVLSINAGGCPVSQDEGGTGDDLPTWVAPAEVLVTDPTAWTISGCTGGFGDGSDSFLVKVAPGLELEALLTMDWGMHTELTMRDENRSANRTFTDGYDALTLSTFNTSVGGGARTIRVDVNSLDDEGEWSLTLTTTGTPLQHDAAVEAITVSPTTVSPGSVVTLNVRLFGNGPGPSPSVPAAYTLIGPSGERVALHEGDVLGPRLLSTETTTTVVRLPTNLSAGAWNVEVTLDPNSTSSDGNSSNNVALTTIPIGVTRPCEAQQNDGGSGDDAGDSVGSALSVGDDPDVVVVACVDSGDNVDWYKFSIGQQRELGVRAVAALGSQISLTLYDETGSVQLASASGAAPLLDTLDFSVIAGIHTLRVQRQAGQGDYSLEFISSRSIDLRILSLFTGDEVEAGQSIFAEVTLEHRGRIGTPSPRIDFALVPQDGSAAIPLDSHLWQGTPTQGDTSVQSFPVEVPRTVPGGQYRLTATVDLANSIDELWDDDDPVTGPPLTILPAPPDRDDDGHPDASDAFPDDPTQHSDTDGDGYGDLLNGARPDACPSTAGTSHEDRYGCPDADADGWSDPGTGFAAHPAGTADAFPQDGSQWADTDGDGYGNNQSGFQPDACPFDAGTSTADRLGCPDTDGDGYSNALAAWLAHPDGEADAFPHNDEQWRDEDGDGLGDNLVGAGADRCPEVAGPPTGERPGCPPAETSGDQDVSSGGGLEGVGLFAVTLGVVVLLGVLVAVPLVIVLVRKRGTADPWSQAAAGEDDLSAAWGDGIAPQDAGLAAGYAAPAAAPLGQPQGAPQGMPQGYQQPAAAAPQQATQYAQPQGVPQGPPQGMPYGQPQGAPQGPPQGMPQGAAYGQPQGAPQGPPQHWQP